MGAAFPEPTIDHAPHELLVVSDGEARELLRADGLLDRLRDAYRSLSSGVVASPRRSNAVVPGTGWLALMAAYVPDVGIAAKLLTSPGPFQPPKAYQARSSVIAFFNASDGSLRCIMNGRAITGLRTAGTCAISVDLLANRDAHVLAVLGAGDQAAAHLDLVPQVRKFDEIRVAARDPLKANRLADNYAKARAVSGWEEAVHQADVVCLCTHSETPLVRYEWFAPGAHITSVGTHPGGSELDGTTFQQARLFVETHSVIEPPPAGSAELEAVDPGRGTEIGEVLLGAKAGRRQRSELTLFKSVGHAAADCAAASLVYERAVASGVGRVVPI